MKVFFFSIGQVIDLILCVWVKLIQLKCTVIQDRDVLKKWMYDNPEVPSYIV